VTILEVLPIAILGGVAGLDTVSFPQAMISRPIVAATFGGALLGAPARGLLVGAVLELIALETLPVGASRYPEWGSASVVGGAMYARTASVEIGALTATVLGALFVAWIGGWTMFKLRQRNVVVAARHRAALDAGARGAVVRVQLAGLTADLVRGMALSALAYVALTPVVSALLGRWTLSEQWSRATLVATAASVALGASWKLFHSTAWARWCFFGGVGAGLVILWIR